MYSGFLDYLKCPLSSSNLRLIILESSKIKEDIIIDSGLLISDSNDLYIYPIINGIPRLLIDSILLYKDYILKYKDLLPHNIYDKIKVLKPNVLKNQSAHFNHIRKSFSVEWENLSENDRAWGRSVDLRLKEFLKRLDINEDDLNSKRILDAGCGHGEIEFALSKFKIDLIALDISNSIDDIKNRYEMNASIEKKAKIHFIQADISQLPLKDELFNYIFSDGVLHHTPDTKKSFNNVCKTIKYLGKCFIMVYSYDHKTIWDKSLDKTIQLLRKVTSKMNPKLLYKMCYVLSPFYLLYVNTINLLSTKQNMRTKRTVKELSLSLFDGLSPMFDWNHSAEEVISWYEEFGFSDIKKTFYNHIGIGIVGIKSKDKLRKTCAASAQ